MDGLNGLAPLQQIDISNDVATPQERSGYPVNPRHAHTGEQARPYSWQSQEIQGGKTHGPYGVEAQMIGDEYWFLSPAGDPSQDPLMGKAPWTHAGPWPADPIGDGSDDPDNIRRQLRDNYALRAAVKPSDHAKNNVYSRNFALQDDWEELYEINPGSDTLDSLPPQSRSGFAPGGRGGTDRRQSNAHQNSFGYDSKHMHRRYAAGSIPGNYLWMKPGGRPMIKSLPGPARPPIGPDSPFSGDDIGLSFAYDNGAILQDNAAAYEAPPEPYVSPQPVTDAYAMEGTVDVELY